MPSSPTKYSATGNAAAVLSRSTSKNFDYAHLTKICRHLEFTVVTGCRSYISAQIGLTPFHLAPSAVWTWVQNSSPPASTKSPLLRAYVMIDEPVSTESPASASWRWSWSPPMSAKYSEPGSAQVGLKPGYHSKNRSYVYLPNNSTLFSRNRSLVGFIEKVTRSTSCRSREFSALVTAATAHAISQGPRTHSPRQHWRSTHESESKHASSVKDGDLDDSDKVGLACLVQGCLFARRHLYQGGRGSASMPHRCLCLVVGSLRCGHRLPGLRWARTVFCCI